MSIRKKQISDSSHRLKDQMFDPSYRRISVAGVPVFNIPKSENKYRSFLEWWFQVGRKSPEDSQGWSTLSGPGVMRDRVEAISAEDWGALTAAEQDLIRDWAENLPVGLFYD